MADTVGGSVVWNLDVDNAKLKAGLNEAKSDVESAAKDIDNKAEGIKGSLSRVGDVFKTGGLAAGGFLAGITGLGVAMANVASDFEQNRIAFETMIGNADLAHKTLADLSNFAVKTPFEFPQLLTASKSLLAYGVEAQDLIPTLKTLGDIAAGVGMDKLPQLILAFGQVKAATKLTGMELRQFTEAGVPLLGALVDKANETGGVLTKMGGLSKEQAKKVSSLTSALADQEFRMNLLTKAGKNQGIAWETLKHKYEQNKKELASFGAVGEATYKKVQVTAQDMIKKISDGEIKFDQVQQALAGMTSEGGRFFDLMDKQSATFGGVMSNIKDQVTRSLAEIAGIDIQAGGLIREGSLFDMLKKGAEAALNALNVLTPVLVGFVQNVVASKPALMAIAGAIGGALVLAVGAFVVAFGPALLVLGAFVAGGALVGFAIGQLVEAFGGMQNIMNAVNPIFQMMGDIFKNLILPQLQALWGQITTDLIPALQGLWNVVSPVLIPVLKILGAILGATLLTAIMTFIGGLRLAVAALTFVVEAVKNTVQPIFALFKWLFDILIGHSLIPDLINGIIGWFRSLPNAISGAVRSVTGVITQPFYDAWNTISGLVNKIKDAIDFTKRHSPSVLDIVKSGVALVQKEISNLGDMSVPPLSASFAAAPVYSPSTLNTGMAGSGTSGNGGVTVNIAQANIKDQQDVEALGREFGFRMGLVK